MKTIATTIAVLFMSISLFSEKSLAHHKLTNAKTEITASSPSVTENFSQLKITALPESRIQINGDSTIKKFSAVAGRVELSGKAVNKPVPNSILLWTPVEIEMSLLVENLKSDDKTLDNHMHETLKFEKYPTIKLNLSIFNFYGDSAIASGTITIAGVSKPVELIAAMSVEGLSVHVIGNKKILMSDFGIEPPTMMLGTLKTRDEIEINFDLVFSINNEKKE